MPILQQLHRNELLKMAFSWQPIWFKEKFMASEVQNGHSKRKQSYCLKAFYEKTIHFKVSSLVGQNMTFANLGS